MARYLLDTNHLSLAVKQDSVVAQRIFEARLAGIRLGTCLPVLCETEAGIRQVRHKSKYRRDLNQLLGQIRIWPMDLETTRHYGDIYYDLRRRGRVLSQVDIMVAALARQIDNSHDGSRFCSCFRCPNGRLVEALTRQETPASHSPCWRVGFPLVATPGCSKETAPSSRRCRERS